jgi:hypothetical protein
MKPRLLLLIAAGLGLTALTFFLSCQTDQTNRSAEKPLAKPAPKKNETETPIPAQPPSSRSTRITTDAPQRGLDEATRDAAHAKVKQWLVTKTGDAEAQDLLLEEFAALLTDENVAEVMQDLSPQEFDTPFSTKALDRWLKVDPLAAARWIAARADARDEHALTVARQLIERPADLRVYADLLPDGPWKQNVLNHASLELAGKDPAAAVSYAQKMTAGAEQTNALETIAYDWFGRDLTAATTWVKNVDDPALRERLFAVAAKAIAVNDPDLAAGWLVDAVKTEGVLHETALGLIETWADQQPAEAANWVARFSEAGPRQVAIDVLLSHWLKSNPAAANAWIQTLPERDAVLAKLQAEQAERDRAPDKE